MTLLAIDTATQFVSIALHDGAQMLAERTWQSENNHSVELPPAIDELLANAGRTINDLNALAVSIGPGSYTGLRIGVALAKGIAAARDLPLVGISTLDIVAAAHPKATGALIVILGAGRGRIVTARYHWRKGGWKQRGAAENMDYDMLLASIDAPATITGEISDAGLERIEAAHDLPITVAPPNVRFRRAGFLAEQAWERLRADGAAAYPAAHVIPVYVKTKDSP